MITPTLALRLFVTLVMSVIAVAAGWLLWSYYMESPWTRDGRVAADTVQVAPDVSGPVVSVNVVDNQLVKAGDVLFVIDPTRFRLALTQAEASLAEKRAAAIEMAEQSARRQQLSEIAISEEGKQEAAAAADEAAAAERQAEAALDIAKLNLERSTVRAPVDGYVTALTMRVGNYAHAGTAAIAMIDAGSFYVRGYFEETKLPRIADGAPVTIRLMGVSQPLKGRVMSIARGISDSEVSVNTATLVAEVQSTFSWVRLAQRIPVHISIDEVPEGVRLAAGMTCTVVVEEP